MATRKPAKKPTKKIATKTSPPRPAPVTPFRDGDLPEPINQPVLVRQFHIDSSAEAANILVAANVLGFDATIDTYQGLVADDGTTRYGVLVRVWDEQIYSAYLGPDPRPTDAD